MKKSRADDRLNNPGEKPQVLLKAVEAIKSIALWINWLTMSYQSYSFDNSEKRKGSILDNCPGCGGLGFIAVKVKRNIYQYVGEYDESEACPICLTGKDKNERLGIPYHLDKPVCQFTVSCPFKDKSQKQEKCHKCNCKFDKGVSDRDFHIIKVANSY